MAAATIVQGNQLAASWVRELSRTRAAVSEAVGRDPRLDLFVVAPNAAIESFIAKKIAVAQEIGVSVFRHDFDQDVDIAAFLEKMVAHMQESDGFVVQLPLPDTLPLERILKAVPEPLDVDVLNPEHFAAYARGEDTFVPPVAAAVDRILQAHEIDPVGKSVVVVGSGRLVGAPAAAYFKRRGVLPQIIDKDTEAEEAKALLSRADIIVSGAGVPNLIGPDDIKEGVVLIDAGTSGSKGVLQGDIDYACQEKAAVFARTPGGVGPLTVAALFANLIDGFLRRSHVS